MLAPDGSVVQYETVRRLTGEQTGLDLSRRVELNIFDDATVGDRRGIRGAARSSTPAEEARPSRSRTQVEDWPASPPWSAGDFRRLDESDDAQFYPKEQPRLVYHIDEGAVAAGAVAFVLPELLAHWPRAHTFLGWRPGQRMLPRLASR